MLLSTWSELNGNRPAATHASVLFLWSEDPCSCRALERSEMLLADRIKASLTESVKYIAIGCLQCSKYGNVTRLKIVQSMRRKATQDDASEGNTQGLPAFHEFRSHHKSILVVFY